MNVLRDFTIYFHWKHVGLLGIIHSVLGLGGWFSASAAIAQIVPDATLPENSRVTVEGNTYTLEGGTQAGSNLFHSFEDFSIPTGAEAFFNNATAIDNILTRVTGDNISNLDGLIRANGTANLFLLNPNGIVFGENARLDIGGSFFASTADRLEFAGGQVFDATSAEATPLLSVNVPVGLQMGNAPNPIHVEGRGHGFVNASILILPIDLSRANEGFEVVPGQTLALVGGDVFLNGGVLRASGGQLELASTRGGTVGFDRAEASTGWQFDYSNTIASGTIQLTGQAALDTSGLQGGAIAIVGGNLSLDGASVVLVRNFADSPTASLNVRASESLTLSTEAVLRSETIGEGRAAPIAVSTSRLVLEEGGLIFNVTFGLGQGNRVDIRASESLEANGVSSRNPSAVSGIGVATNSIGNAGDLRISTGRLVVLDGGGIGTPAGPLAMGQGGNIFVEATESIELRGFSEVSFNPSNIDAVTLGSGKAGSIAIDTPRLILRDGGEITSSNLATGAAGDIAIRATESVEVAGVPSDPMAVPTRISSATIPASEAARLVFGLPDVPTGDAGSVEIVTPDLLVAEGGSVTVQNAGIGRAGNVRLESNSRVRLERNGTISAATQLGEGGNLAIQTPSLQLRGSSQISTEAGGTGNGGNMAIATDTLVVLDNSSIVANAVEGAGGNIQIETQGLFVGSQSRITASSQFGIDGIVSVTEPEVDTSAGLIELSSTPLDPATQVSSACDVARENSFVVTGNGGLPPDPTRVLGSGTVWEDLRLTEISEPADRSPAIEIFQYRDRPLVEATGWHLDETGTVELVARPRDRDRPFRLPSCASFR
ncbi:Putative hemagglutinin-related protein [Geitlerinema sp. FC II]|nr:Putative hemagglutinin-related protein [Geitlerinema sp. FC II]